MACECYPLGEFATTCIARLISRLAWSPTRTWASSESMEAEALRIVAIARYYSSSRLANHEMSRTLQAVQLRFPGL